MSGLLKKARPGSVGSATVIGATPPLHSVRWVALNAQLSAFAAGGVRSMREPLSAKNRPVGVSEKRPFAMTNADIQRSG